MGKTGGYTDNDGQLHVIVPAPEVAAYLEKNHRSLIEKAYCDVTGKECPAICWEMVEA